MSIDKKEYDINFYRKNYPNDNGFRDQNYYDRIKIGKNLKTVISNISTKLVDPKSRQKQISTAIEILSCCHSPWAANGKKRAGLVVGKVQSGKTTSFTALSAAAADNGYRLIIHLLGTTSSLVNSNLKDVKHYLGLNDPNDAWFVTGISPGDVSLDVTGPQLANILKNNPLSRRNNQKKVVYISLMKRKEPIELLTKVLKQAKLNSFLELNTLIIDDEVDSHSIDISKPKEPESSTNRLLKELRDAAGTCTYIGYTATSAAVKHSHQTNFLSPDIHALLEPGKGYVGNVEYFGEPDGWLDESDHLNWKDTNIIKTLKIKQRRVHSYTKGGKVKYYKKPKLVDDEKSLVKSMKEPVCDFLISQDILAERWKGTEKNPVFTMMLVPSVLARKTRPGELNHSQVKYHLENFLTGELHSKITNNNKTSDIYLLLKRIYKEKKSQCNKSDLKKFPKLDDIIKRLEMIFDPNLTLHGSVYTVAEMNQHANKNLNFDASDIWFLIGGANLSRGFVVQGLLTTWMPLSPHAYVLDTMQQRGRFFGYKEDYLDLISVYLKKVTIDNFRNYTLYEKQQWRELEESKVSGVRLPDSDVSYLGAEGLHDLTSSSKRKNDNISIFRRGWATAHHLTFSSDPTTGKPIKNAHFHNHIESYINRLTSSGLLKPVNPQNNRFNAKSSVQVFKSVKAPTSLILKDLLIPLLSKKMGLSKHDKKFRDTIKFIKEDMNPATECNVILFDGGLSRTFFTKSHADNIKAHRWQQNYGTGAGSVISSLKSSNAYCGDSRVLLHKNLNPLNPDMNLKEKNHNLTIQIHKMDGRIDRSTTNLLKDLFAIRILLPRRSV